MNKTSDDLNKKLGKLREDKRELGVKIGQMSTTSKSDASYSSAKLDNWQREMESLVEKENELEGELLALQQGPIEPAAEPKAKAEPAKVPDQTLEVATKKAAKEIALIADRSNKRAVEIAKAIYSLTDLLQEQEDDFQAAASLVQVNPEGLSVWQIQASFPQGSLLQDMRVIQKRLLFLRRDLLEKAGLPLVW